MRQLDNVIVLTPLLLLAACAPHAPPPKLAAVVTPENGTVIRELLTYAPFRDRLSHAPADLAIFFAGEESGSLEDCGCAHRPRGSLARFIGYVQAESAAAPAPSLRVHAGYWATDAVDYAGNPIADAIVKDAWMMRGLSAAGFDAINVSAHDVAGMVAVPPDPELPLVSANVSGPGVRRWVELERGGRKIGITGITGPAATMADTSVWPTRPPEAAAGTLAELVARDDVVVLLAWNANEAIRKLVRDVPGIDVVIDAGIYSEASEPVFRHDTLWTFAAWDLVRAGELRLRLDGGRILGALDRQVDLDDAVPPDSALARITRDAAAEIATKQKAIYPGG